jgi:hypothetical protein
MQVYGFGHYDPNVEGIFLRFADWNDTRSPTLSQLPITNLEISSRHFFLLETIHHQSHRIPAADIQVGDILSGPQVQTIQTIV